MTTPRRPGRPRDPNVQARDEVIFRTIADGTSSRSAIAAATGHDRDAVYLSCKRLQREGRVTQTLSSSGTVAWITAEDPRP